MLEFTVLSESREKLFLLAENADVRLLNALRRTVISDLPCFAVDDVSFYENNSPLFNEYISNRIALIPLTYEEGVADDAKIAFELNVEAVDVDRVVYSRELTSTDPAIKVFAEKIPLIKLGKGQKLRLEAIAVKGTAKQHAKFQNALANYGALDEFKLASKCKKCSAEMNPKPKELLSDKALKALKEKAPELSFQCPACSEEARVKAGKKKAGSEAFIFSVESFNNLSAREQLERAFTIIQEKMDSVAKELK